jgi:hypothetical protein
VGEAVAEGLATTENAVHVLGRTLNDLLANNGGKMDVSVCFYRFSFFEGSVFFIESGTLTAVVVPHDSNTAVVVLFSPFSLLYSSVLFFLFCSLLFSSVFLCSLVFSFVLCVADTGTVRFTTALLLNVLVAVQRTNHDLGDNRSVW